MGYTHYWESYAERLPDEAVIVLREILGQAYASKVIQYECNDSSRPVVTNTEIRFNGRNEEGHETFHLSVPEAYRTADGKPFAFCKTARKPYDEVVMKVLIVLKFYLRDKIKITSDGAFDDEWHEVREEMEDKYGIHTYTDCQLLVE